MSLCSSLPHLHKLIVTPQQRVQRLQQQLDSLVDEALAPAEDKPDDDNFEDDWDAFDEPIASSSTSAPKRKHILFSSDLETGPSSRIFDLSLSALTYKTLSLSDSPLRRPLLSPLQASSTFHHHHFLPPQE